MKARQFILLFFFIALPIVAESEEIEIIDNIELLDAMDFLEDDSWEAINSEDDNGVSSAENN